MIEIGPEIDERIAGFRLSPQQRRAWLLLRRGGAAASRLVLAVAEDLPAARLRAAVARLVERHEVLRATYARLPGMLVPVQVVRPDGPPLWEELALDGDGAAAERRLAELVEEEGRREFDLETGPLVRATLVSGPNGDRRLLLALAPLCADSRAVDSLAAELADLCAGRTPQEPVSYLQVAEYQNALLEGEQGEDLRRAWSRRQLAAPPRPRLPFELPGRTEEAPYRPATVAFAVAPATAAALGAQARSGGLPLPVLVLACWQALIWRLTGQEEVVLAYLCDGRTHEVFAAAVGLFARWLPVDVRCTPGMPFGELLARVADGVNEGEEAAEGFLWGMDGDAPKGDLWPAVGFVGESRPQAGGGPLRVLRKEAVGERCDLLLRLQEGSDALAAELVFDAGRFAAADVERVARCLRCLLAAVAEDPRRPVDELPLLALEDERRLLAAAGAPPPSLPRHAAFHRWFEAQADRSPAAPALAFAEEQLTYRQLDERANRLARHLRRLGVGPEVPVLLYLDRSLDLVVALLATLKAGGAYVPLAPGQPQKRLACVLEDLGGPVVLTHSARRDELPSACRAVDLDAEAAAVATHPGERLDVEVAPENLAYVIFTSGSTGRPKGVMVEHRQLLNYVAAVLERLDFPAGARCATVSTFAADLGNTMIFPALCTGGCLHVVDEETASDPEALARLFERHEVDCLKIVPSHYQALRQELADAGRLLPRRRLVFGGEALPPALAREVDAGAGECAVFNHYGPSETTVGVVCWRVAPAALDPRCRTVPLGEPLGGVAAYVLDDLLAPVPEWVAGELYLGGANVSRGYLGGPAATAERFLPDPFGGRAGARLYRTGDEVQRLPGGALVFLGRVDNQVKFHGFRVELDEVRGALNRHPKVRDSVVAVKQDGRGRDLLVAYYVARQEIDAAELRQLLLEVILEETLPNLFVHLKKLPLTLNGKVNYAALPEVGEAQRRRRVFVAPRTPAEELMAQIWSDVLGLERLGREDNFFDLGGHSLLATQLVSRVRQAFALELPLRSLFETTSLGEFTAEVERQLAAAPPPGTIGRVPRQRELPLSFAQERLWFMDQLAPGNAAYNVHAAFHLAGVLDAAALARAVRRVVARHESLRTTFAALDGRAVQVIAPAAAVPLPRVDLRALPAARREAEARRLAAAESWRPFDLARGPLLRALLVRLDGNEHVLSLTIHHIVADGWSLGILMRELSHCYAAVVAGPARPLPELPVQYADYAVWQREWLQGEALERQLAYWRARLAGMPDLELPADRPRPAVSSFAGANHPFQLSPELSAALRGLGRRHRTTLFMTLLAAFDVLLGRSTGLEDVVVGTDVAMRERIEFEGLIGFFVNNLVLRTDLTGDPTFAELLARVRETTLGAYANQDMPLERLVKELRPRRELGQAPLFQVLFAQQSARRPGWDLPGIAATPLAGEKVTAKFDVACFFRESEDGRIVGRWNYRQDLFEETTIATLARHFETLLGSICADPEAHLSRLEMLTPEERREQTVINEERRSRKLGSLRSARRQTVDLAELELVKTGFLDGAHGMPLLVEPALDGVDLAEWAAGSRDRIDGWLLDHGALLCRGFGGGGVVDFERFARSVTGELYGDYGDLPREEGSDRVYHSTPYPQDKMILFHNESSHLSRWPTRQMFHCVVAAQSGGETPIVDCRRMVRELPPELVGRLRERKIMYVRNFTDGLDVSWQHFFRTADRAVVERKCRDWSMDYEWKADGLRTRQVCEAVVKHPRTGEESFFNQIQLFHGACMDPEVRRSMLEVFDGKDLPRDLRYGDGSPVEDEVVAEISAAYERLAVAFPWRQGDVLLLDNMLVAHARNPFSGPRKIVVAMGDMMSREELRA
jgi:amino acid adenylation domain-containing protein